MRYTSAMDSILLYPLAVTVYAGLAAYAWMKQFRKPMPDKFVRTRPLGAEQMVLLLVLFVHGATLRQAIFGGDSLRFGFAIALSVMVWLALAIFWIENIFTRIDSLKLIGLPVAVICAPLPALFPDHHVLLNTGSAYFRIHLLVSMLAYSLFMLSALHALLMAATEHRLHSGRISPLLAGLPPLLSMETLLFRLIHIAFVLLTISVVSGIGFSEVLFGRALRFDHKTIFVILSWLIFAALLLGRHLRGWRGRIAVNWTIAGFAALLLAYVGTQFVLEILLSRSA